MESGNRPLRVLLVDDHDLFRGGLRSLLEEQGLEVDDAAGGQEALERLDRFQPDVVVMDMNMPGMSGVEATRRVRQRLPGGAVLMLTVAADDDGVRDAVLAGASGYLLKDARLDDIVAGIRAAAAGEVPLSTRVAGGLLARVRDAGDTRPAGEDAAPLLTDRERAVLALLVEGCENAEIGRRLHISASTVKHHLSSVMEKLGVDNRVQAAVVAIRYRLVDDVG